MLKKSNAGFSLIELSIVLVIVALIAGGVMLGKDLIRAAEIRGQISQIKEIESAFTTFRDKYQALPGDMANATDFWGIAGGTGSDATCYDTDSTTLADPKNTCNGDGDGAIGSTLTACPVGSNCAFAERFRFWQHLANAGLIAGNFSGRTGPVSSWDTVKDTNVPAGKVRSSTLTIFSQVAQISGNPNRFDNTGLIDELTISGNSDAAGTFASLPFTPEEAWTIDSKLDDGNPTRGNVFNHKKTAPSTPNCTTADDYTAEYDLTNTDRVCLVKYVMRHRM